MALSKVGLIDPAIDSVSIRYAANVTGNASVTRSLAVGYTDGRVPQSNLDVTGNAVIGTIYVASNNTVGIGAMPHTGKFQVDSGSTSVTGQFGSTAASTTYFRLGASGTANYPQLAVTGDVLTFRTSYADRMTLTAAGLLGIGTTAPHSNQLIQLYGGASGGAGSTDFGMTIENSGDSQLQFLNPESAGYTSRINFGSVTNARDGMIAYTQSAKYMAFHAANAEKLRLNSTGLGIGTTSPATALDVNGTILASSNTYATAQGSITLDFSATQNFVLTFIADVTFANPSTEQVGQAGIFVITQGASGGPHTLSLGTDYETAGSGGITLSTGANDVDIIPYFVKASGAIMLGAVQKDFG